MGPYTMAEKVIELLGRRGGFDHWWDEIEPEIQEEIIDELYDLFSGELS